MISITVFPDTLSFPKITFDQKILKYFIENFYSEKNFLPNVLILSMSDFSEIFSSINSCDNLPLDKIGITFNNHLIEIIRTHDLSPGDIRIY